MKIISKIGIALVGLSGIGVISSVNNDTEFIKEEKIESEVISETVTCNGLTVTENCELNGIKYDKYIYHPAVEEQSHYESNIVGYKQVVVGYCTLCNDGTRSPSCSTGRGTCSHHGGVKEWNAPIYKEEAVYEEVKIVDTPAADAWYEIIKSE